MSIHQRFKQYVKYSKKSITLLSKEIGVSQKGLNNLASGSAQPSTKMLLALMRLEISIDWLLSGEGEMLRKKSSGMEGNQIINKDGTIMGVGNNNNIENKSIQENLYLKEIEYLKSENELLKSKLEDKDQIITLLTNKS